MAHPYLYAMHNDESVFQNSDSDATVSGSDLSSDDEDAPGFLFDDTVNLSDYEKNSGTDSDNSAVGEEEIWQRLRDQEGRRESDSAEEYEYYSDESNADMEVGSGAETPEHMEEQPEQVNLPVVQEPQLLVDVPEKAQKYCRGQNVNWNEILRQPALNEPRIPDSKGVVTRILRGLPVHMCHVCGKRYCYESTMLKHCVEQHYLEVEELQCHKCGKVYTSAAKLAHHVASAECERTWANPTVLPRRAPVKPTLKAGPTEVLKYESPMLLFLRYIMPIIEVWLPHLNRRGKFLFPDEMQRIGKARLWTDVTVSEALQWIKLYLACGFMKYRSNRDPWRQSDLFSNVMFTTTMSGNRFNQIRKASCFANSALEQLPNGRGDKTGEHFDELWRVRDILNAFIGTAQRLMNPSRELCVDEMMIAFKGKFGHVQNMPSKPIKRGIKVFILSDPVTGYIYNAIPYVKQTFPLAEELGKIASFVIALLRGTNAPNVARDFLNKGHYLVTDSYFTSFKLMEWLLKKFTYYIGTLVTTRKCPLEMQTADRLVGDRIIPFTRGQYKFAQSNTGVQLCTWLDNKRVIIASTTPSITTQVGKCRRKIMLKERGHKTYIGTFGLKRPKICGAYQKWYGGVDLCNQLISYHHFQFQSRRWIMPVFYQLIDMCVLNAFTIYSKHNDDLKEIDKNYSTREFRRLLIEEMDAELKDKPIAQNRANEGAEEQFAPKKWGLMGNAEKHKINVEKIQRKKFHRIAKLEIRGTCAVCSKRCFVGCIACEVGMHAIPCFTKFHSQ